MWAKKEEKKSVWYAGNKVIYESKERWVLILLGKKKVSEGAEKCKGNMNICDHTTLPPNNNHWKKINVFVNNNKHAVDKSLRNQVWYNEF